MEIAPAKTGRANNNKIAVTKIAHTNTFFQKINYVLFSLAYCISIIFT